MTSRILLILLSIFCFKNSDAQVSWSAPVSIAANTFGNYWPRIALDRNNKPLVIWGQSSGSKVNFSRWNGTSFTTPVALNMASMPAFFANWAGSTIATFGDTVYVAFKQTPETDSTKHIYLLRSFNGGQSFMAPVRVDYVADSLSRFAHVTTDAIGNPVVAFMKFDPGFGNARYVVARSMDFGASFMADRKASGYNNALVCDCCPGTILNYGNRYIMLYRNDLNDIRTIWAGISNDNGNSFSGLEVDNTNWSINSCPSTGPDGIVVGDTLYTVFRSSATGMKVYLSKSTLNTPQLVSTNLIFPPGTGTMQDYPRIANNGNAAAIVWRESTSGVTRGFLTFTNNILNGFTGIRDTVWGAGVTNIDVAMANGEIHVVWENDNNGTVMYRKGTYTPVNVPSINKNELINIFPNPVNEFFYIPLSNVKSCILADISGRKYDLPFEQSADKAKVSLDQIAAGIYTVEIIDRSGKGYSSKIEVQ
jgi:hypothetical protein